MSETKHFFTSDTHFFHKNILKFCPTTRKGQTVEEMNEILIRNWQEQVGANDIVHVLGDCFFCDAESAIRIMDRLPGHKYLTYGNHDKVIKNNSALRNKFVSVQDYREISICAKQVILFHFPMLQWNKMHYGSYHLFGHVHGSVPPYGRAMDVGVDTRPDADMRLWSWEEIDARLSKGEILGHHKPSAT